MDCFFNTESSVRRFIQRTVTDVCKLCNEMMHSFLSGRRSEEHRCAPRSAVTPAWPSCGSGCSGTLRAGHWLPAQHSGQLCNLHCMGGLCRLSSQWLILAYSCPWWYVKYSVASLFLSFLWSWCRNVSGLGARCLRAEPGPLLPVLHEK